jgi:glycosyltransferase involved in cell wall biosynthesis
VVIPCYRQAHFLPEALASVFQQTYPAVEAVVVNDGSPDDTDEVARAYLPRIVYVRQENVGLPGARNAGIRASSGKYLLFLDADDLLHPQAIEWLVAAVGDREDRLAQMGFCLFQRHPNEPATQPFVPDGDQLLPHLIHENRGPVHAYLCSRVSVERAGLFEESLRSCEDWDLWLRLAVDGVDWVPVPHVGAYYRKYQGSMSTNHVLMLEARARVLLRAHRRFIADPHLLLRWGGDLLGAEFRVRRRCLSQRAAAELVHQLSRAIRELGERGYRIRRSVPKSLLDALVGQTTVERLAMAYYKRFVPAVYEVYRSSYT